jgi:hypothetical protein
VATSAQLLLLSTALAFLLVIAAVMSHLLELSLDLASQLSVLNLVQNERVVVLKVVELEISLLDVILL